MVELTETISHLPAGSQLLFSSATFEKLFGRLHEIRLPADPMQKQCSLQQVPLSKKALPILEVSSDSMATYLLDEASTGLRAAAAGRIVQSLP